MVLKPSEIAPLSSIILAEMIDEIKLPKGVFNLINGDGAVAGNAGFFIMWLVNLLVIQM